MSRLAPLADSPATLVARGEVAGQPGIHLLCIGISDYADAPLSSAAASALGVFCAFLRLAESATLPLSIQSARLVVAPSAAEEALVSAQQPQHAALFAAARGRLGRGDLDRLLNEWFERVRTQPQDVALFYFAGHGLGEDESPDQESKTLLLARDFEEEFRRPPRAVAVQHLLSALQPASADDPVARSQLYLIDCCRERTWDGPPAQQGELMIAVADRLRSDRRAHDDRRVAVDYACCAGDRAWSQASDVERGVLAVTNYASALIAALDASHALPELRAHELLRRIQAALLQRHEQQTRHGRCDDFPLRAHAAGRPAGAVQVAIGSARADSRAPTELADLAAVRSGDPGVAQALSPPRDSGPRPPASLPEAPATSQALTPRSLGSWLLLACGALGVLALVAALHWRSRASSTAVLASSPSTPTGPPASVSVAARPAGVVLSGSVRLGPFSFVAGSSVAEARGAYDACLASAGQGGRVAAREGSTLPCSKPFEASLYVRETWFNGPRSGPAFYLDRLEVTWEQLASWLNGVKSQLVINDAPPEGVPWVAFSNGSPLVAIQSAASQRRDSKLVLEGGSFHAMESDAKLPGAFVSWEGASAYCKAQDKRLPTEVEWEFAARGAARRAWPWAGDAPPACANVSFGRGSGQPCAHRGLGPSPVGVSSGDVTPDGVFDLAGNVLEWTSDSFESKAPDAACAAPGGCKVVRGGSFLDDAALLRAASRGRLPIARLSPNVGFRCARDAT